jgi:1-phosphofructokinase
VVSVQARPLSRHAADELYGVALAAGLDANVMLLTGCQPSDVIDAEFYRRLAGDLHNKGTAVIPDLTEGPVQAALAGGAELIKLSDEELVACKPAASPEIADIVGAAWSMHEAGA